MARSNTLDEVIGGAELLVPAERRPTGDRISLGGEWLLVELESTQWVVFDLSTGSEQALSLSCPSLQDMVSWHDARWLNEQQFVITTPLSRCYYLVEMPEVVATPLPIVPEDPARLAQASPPIYITKSLAMGGSTAFALGDDPFVMHLHNPEHAYDPPAWAATIPHIEVPKSPRGEYTVSSRSERCYANNDHGVSIYAAKGDLLARAGKKNWNHYILDWAHDDSAVYFALTIEGSDAAVFYPWELIWKLKVPQGAGCGN